MQGKREEGTCTKNPWLVGWISAFPLAFFLSLFQRRGTNNSNSLFLLRTKGISRTTKCAFQSKIREKDYFIFPEIDYCQRMYYFSYIWTGCLSRKTYKVAFLTVESFRNPPLNPPTQLTHPTFPHSGRSKGLNCKFLFPSRPSARPLPSYL